MSPAFLDLLSRHTCVLAAPMLWKGTVRSRCNWACEHSKVSLLKPCCCGAWAPVNVLAYGDRARLWYFCRFVASSYCLTITYGTAWCYCLHPSRYSPQLRSSNTAALWCVKYRQRGCELHASLYIRWLGNSLWLDMNTMVFPVFQHWGVTLWLFINIIVSFGWDYCLSLASDSNNKSKS